MAYGIVKQMTENSPLDERLEFNLRMLRYLASFMASDRIYHEVVSRAMVEYLILESNVEPTTVADMASLEDLIGEAYDLDALLEFEGILFEESEVSSMSLYLRSLVALRDEDLTILQAQELQYLRTLIEEITYCTPPLSAPPSRLINIVPDVCFIEILVADPTDPDDGELDIEHQPGAITLLNTQTEQGQIDVWSWKIGAVRTYPFDWIAGSQNVMNCDDSDFQGHVYNKSVLEEAKLSTDLAEIQLMASDMLIENFGVEDIGSFVNHTTACGLMWFTMHSSGRRWQYNLSAYVAAATLLALQQFFPDDEELADTSYYAASISILTTTELETGEDFFLEFDFNRTEELLREFMTTDLQAIYAFICMYFRRFQNHEGRLKENMKCVLKLKNVIRSELKRRVPGMQVPLNAAPLSVVSPDEGELDFRLAFMPRKDGAIEGRYISNFQYSSSTLGMGSVSFWDWGIGEEVVRPETDVMFDLNQLVSSEHSPVLD